MELVHSECFSKLEKKPAQGELALDQLETFSQVEERKRRSVNNEMNDGWIPFSWVLVLCFFTCDTWMKQPLLIVLVTPVLFLLCYAYSMWAIVYICILNKGERVSSTF